MSRAALSRAATRAFGVAIGAVVLTSACASSAARSVSLSPLPAALDTVWYVSARTRIDGRDSRRLTDSLEYGFVVHARDRMDDALTGAINVTIVDSVQLSRAQFEQALANGAAAARGADDFAVLYVHGFGTSLREGWQYAAEARIRSRHPARWIVFCWPSNGLGVSWPRAREILTRAYHDDTELASASRPAFVRAAQSVLAAVGASRVVLASHSLGGRVVGEALANDSVLRESLARDPLRAVAFVTPDVESQYFGDTIVPAARRLARRVVLYTSGRDRVLAMARQIHDADRAGQTTRVPLVRTGLETVDVTNGLVAEGWVTARVGTHHAIRRASAAIFDLTYLVGGGFTADCRSVMGTARVTADGVWQLTRTRPPNAIEEGQCAPYE